MSAHPLTHQHFEAAQLIADGELSHKGIAEKLGVTQQTICNWKNRPDFMALVEEHLAIFREDVRRRGLANPDRRIRALNDRWNRLQRVIEARADHPDYAEAPGGSTGLLVKTAKMIGSGESARLVHEFAVDATLLRELREHEKQAAMELGQWAEKREVTGKDGGPIATTAPALERAATELDAWRRSMTERLLSITAPPEAEEVQEAAQTTPPPPPRVM